MPPRTVYDLRRRTGMTTVRPRFNTAILEPRLFWKYLLEKFQDSDHSDHMHFARKAKVPYCYNCFNPVLMFADPIYRGIELMRIFRRAPKHALNRGLTVQVNNKLKIISILNKYRSDDLHYIWTTNRLCIIITSVGPSTVKPKVPLCLFSCTSTLVPLGWARKPVPRPSSALSLLICCRSTCWVQCAQQLFLNVLNILFSNKSLAQLNNKQLWLSVHLLCF